MKNSIKNLGLILLSACLSGCATPNSGPLTRINMGGNCESYVGNKEQIEYKIKKYPQLRSWRIGDDIYAEGRTYGVHFAEYATSTNLLDGCATDGFKKR
jgi:hypothetical protein